MSAPKLCVLNTPADAEDFFLRGDSLSERWLLASTHASVNDFLAARGVDCVQLSSLISDNFLRGLHAESDRVVEELLPKLDERLSPQISEILGFDVSRLFYELFRYDLKSDHTGLRCFETALKEISRENSIGEAVFYESGNTPYTGALNPFRVVKDKSGIFKTVTLREAGRTCAPPKLFALGGVFLALEKILLNPAGALESLRYLIKRNFPPALRKGRKTAVLLGSAYDLAFIPDELKDINFIHWTYAGSPKLQKELTRSLSQTQTDALDRLLSDFHPAAVFGEEKIMSLALAEAAVNSLKLNKSNYLEPLLNLRAIDSEYKIDLCLWGNSPAIGSKSLLNYYLKQKSVPVIAAQHGGNYSVQDLDFVHFTTDFTRCDYYFSYGFDKKDLAGAYPDRKFNCEIIPAGSFKEYEKKQADSTRSGARRPKVDILFPPANSMSIFQECRHNSARLAGVQHGITDFLESVTDMTVYIKPVEGSGPGNFALCEKLKTLKNMKKSWLKLSDFYDKYETRLIITEFPSSPLYESLGRDVEILLMPDPIYPFFEEAFELLKKRVHIFNSVEELRTLIEKFRAGTLPRLRDDSYYKKYMLGGEGNPKDTVMRRVNKFLGRE